MAKLAIGIKDKTIPVILRNFKNAKTIKMYFNGTTLNITKPKYVSNKVIYKMIDENKENIYNQYMKIISTENDIIKHWITGEQILYKGEYYKILREEIIKNTIELEINEKEKIFNIKVSQNIKDEELIKYNIDKMIKNLFKNNTGCILQERLPYWSKITKLSYKSFNVRDAKTKYGSCKPDTKQLYFSSRLIMLPEDKIDAIIVHELCHIVHRNHSQNFYDLVKQYIPNYKEIDKWLKQNAKELNF